MNFNNTEFDKKPVNALSKAKKAELKCAAKRSAAIAYLGSQCVQCGFSDLRALQIDHVYDDGKHDRIMFNPTQIYQRILNGSPRYQLLCANCNWIKRFEHMKRSK